MRRILPRSGWPARCWPPWSRCPPRRTTTRPAPVGRRPPRWSSGTAARGGYRPEHTLESYRLAIRMGADYIEPDLVPTKEGVLVARHENEIGGTTDVDKHPEFAGRKTTKTIDGNAVTGWFTEDFTLAELEDAARRGAAAAGAADQHARSTASWRYRRSRRSSTSPAPRAAGSGRTIGIYPETKHPSYFRSIGLPLEEPLVQVLKRNGLNGRKAKVFVQSFETANLRKLDKMTDVPLIQLLDASGRPFDLAAAGDPAHVPGPGQAREPHADRRVRGRHRHRQEPAHPRDPAGRLLPPTTVVRDAHRAGLLVHAWTFRAENQFLPADFRLGTDPNARGDYIAEYEAFYGIGLDGVFADQPDTAVAARAGLAS
ncbi:glycerophosphodiester phosphodiesterase family protein [Yinghuangia aomiensis]